MSSSYILPELNMDVACKKGQSKIWKTKQRLVGVIIDRDLKFDEYGYIFNKKRGGN